MIDMIKQPWPWYIAGPLIGLTVPALLILGNKLFGISSSMKHVCAICLPANISLFKYDWKKEIWNLVFVSGIVLGALIAVNLLNNPNDMIVSEALRQDLATHGISDLSGLMPTELFNWESLFSVKGFIFVVVGGFFVGFGTRYAGGCTSGHSIMGLSSLQWPSLVATCCFMVGGFLSTYFIVPFLLTL